MTPTGDDPRRTMTAGTPGSHAALGVTDAVSVVVGIIVGASIFQAPPAVFGGAGGALAGLGFWLAGGLLSLLGALCYAEMACAYPGPAGDFGFITRAFGRPVGVLFAWAQLAVIRAGAGIAGIAYVFAHHAELLFPLAGRLPAPLAGHAEGVWVCLAVLALSAVNALGVRPGKWTQHALTGAKVLGLAGVVVAGAWLAFASATPWPAAPGELSAGGLSLAMVMVLYAYGGWNEAAYITAELRDPHRDTARVLVLGVALVAGLYFVVNAAYLAALGYDGVRGSNAVAGDVVGRAAGPAGAAAVGVLVMVSALGAVHGMLFTGPRLYGSFARAHRAFALLGPRRGEPAPAGALAAQAGFVVLLVVLFEAGATWKHALRVPLEAAGLAGGGTGGDFEALVACTAPPFWLFFLLAGLSLFVLRWRDPGAARPFRVPLYPWVPLAFCAACGFMLWSSIDYALSKRPAEALLVGALLLPGLPLALTARRDGEDLPRRSDR